MQVPKFKCSSTTDGRNMLQEYTIYIYVYTNSEKFVGHSKPSHSRKENEIGNTHLNWSECIHTATKSPSSSLTIHPGHAKLRPVKAAKHRLSIVQSLCISSHVVQRYQLEREDKCILETQHNSVCIGKVTIWKKCSSIHV